MAFMGRGGSPSIHRSRGGGTSVGDNQGYYRGHYRYRGIHYFIPLNNTYVIMVMITFFIILIVGGITYLTTYESKIIDPIESIKKSFINTQLIIIGVLLALTLMINFFLKNQKALLKILIIVSIISIISMLAFGGIRWNLDTTYTKEKFEQIYIEQNDIESFNKKSKVIGVGITGVKIKTAQEGYVDECMKLYKIFKIKTYGILGAHLLLNILLIYQVLKLSEKNAKKERVNKDDLILFDEEQDIRF